jgi:putative mRNA 3-end processing factor
LTLAQLLTFTDKGIYCNAGNFYIDPWRPVDCAVITHAHSDHARPGSKHYLAHKHSEPILRLRLGHEISLQTVEYGQTWMQNGVKISLHPAGHIVGSAQVRVEYKGEIWVVSGDYKVENDGLSTPFEPVKCHHFISECTFGMPIYRWKPQAEIFDNMNAWWQENKANGKVSVVFAYSLGKAQRVLQGINPDIGSVFVHGAVWNVNKAIEENGMVLNPYTRVEADQTKKNWEGALVIAPGSALGSPWLKKFGDYATASASGWMQVRGQKRRNALDAGFVLSDHADWPGLNEAVLATEAQKVWTTHGYTAVFSRWLNDNGIESEEVVTQFGTETEEESTQAFEEKTAD